MKKRITKIIAFAILLVLCFSALPMSIFARTVVPDNIHTTNVTDDLLKMEAYSKDKFPINKEADYCDIIDLIEWGYDYSGKTVDYALFLYIYNPGCKEIDMSKAYKNRIQLRAAPVKETVAGGDTPWEKYQLTFVNKSENNLFYKFKIDVPQSYMRKPDKTRRIYEIADVEFIFKGETKSRSCGASGQWIYTGYQEYHDKGGSNKYSTLLWDSDNILTVDLDVKSASWKTATSDKGQGYQYEISSVYFAVPDTIIKEYGNPNDVYKGLREVEYYAENYKISGVSTKNQDFYETLEQYVNVDYNVYDVPFGFVTSPYKYSPSWSKYGFNVDPFLQISQFYVIDELLDSYGNAFYDVVGKGSENFVNSVTNRRDDGLLFAYPGSFSDKVNKVKSDGDDLAKLISTRSAKEGSWNFWDFAKGVPKYNDEGEYEGIEPIVAVDESYIVRYEDTACGDKYFICNEDSTDFCNYVKSNMNGNTTFLMRFAVTDYYCSNIGVARSGAGNDMDATQGNYYFEKEIFLDFDILTLTWERANGTRTVLPVKASPIDITGNPSYPSEYDPDKNSPDVNTDGSFANGNDNSGCGQILQLRSWVLIGGAVIIVVLLCCFPSLLGLLGKIFGVLFLPIVWIFNGIGKFTSWLFEKIFVPDHAKKTDHKLKIKEKEYDENKALEKEQRAKAEREERECKAKEDKKGDE